jgi:tetratricopeptide (TPR) repeat protein
MIRQKGTMKGYENGKVSQKSLPKLTMEQVAALVSLAHTFYSQGRLEDATKILEGLTVLDGGIPYAFGLLGSIYQKKKDYAAAVDRYTKALLLEPDETYCLVNRGEVHLRLGRFQDAATDLIRAMESDPDAKHPAANRARFLIAIAQDALNQLSMESGKSPQSN